MHHLCTALHCSTASHCLRTCCQLDQLVLVARIKCRASMQPTRHLQRSDGISAYRIKPEASGFHRLDTYKDAMSAGYRCASRQFNQVCVNSAQVNCERAMERHPYSACFGHLRQVIDVKSANRSAATVQTKQAKARKWSYRGSNPGPQRY